MDSKTKLEVWKSKPRGKWLRWAASTDTEFQREAIYDFLTEAGKGGASKVSHERGRLLADHFSPGSAGMTRLTKNSDTRKTEAPTARFTCPECGAESGDTQLGALRKGQAPKFPCDCKVFPNATGRDQKTKFHSEQEAFDALGIDGSAVTYTKVQNTRLPLLGNLKCRDCGLPLKDIQQGSLRGGNKPKHIGVTVGDNKMICPASSKAKAAWEHANTQLGLTVDMPELEFAMLGQYDRVPVTWGCCQSPSEVSKQNLLPNGPGAPTCQKCRETDITWDGKMRRLLGKIRADQVLSPKERKWWDDPAKVVVSLNDAVMLDGRPNMEILKLGVSLIDSDRYKDVKQELGVWFLPQGIIEQTVLSRSPTDGNIWGRKWEVSHTVTTDGKICFKGGQSEMTDTIHAEWVVSQVQALVDCVNEDKPLPTWDIPVESYTQRTAA